MSGNDGATFSEVIEMVEGIFIQNEQEKDEDASVSSREPRIEQV